jgi:hypothetical protein
MVFILLFLFLFRFWLLSGRKTLGPHNDDVWHPLVSTFPKNFAASQKIDIVAAEHIFTALRAALRATQSPVGDKSTAMEGARTNQQA